MALPNNPTQLEVIKEVKRLEAEKYDASNPNGYTNNNGTVTSVGAGAGLSISGTASVNPTVNVDSDHKLLSNDEYALLATKRFVLDELDDLPTVNNKTITIQKNGTTVKSFTLNQSSDETINITLAKGDVGLGNVDNVRQYSASNPPPYPVSSVNGKTGAVTGLATSNPNLLINSNFAINQRDGYFAPIDTVVYENADGTNPIGRVATAIQTTIVSATIRRATNVSVKGVSTYKYRETFASAQKLKLTYNIYGNELTTPDLYGVSGTAETKIGASSYTYDRLYNRIMISDSGVLEAYNTFAVYYALDTNAQTISGTLYFKTSDCVSGYIGAIYGVDRWAGYQNTTMIATPRTNGGITLYNSTSTSAQAIYVYKMEESDFSKLLGKTCTLSFYIPRNGGTSTITMRVLVNGSGIGTSSGIASGSSGKITYTFTLSSSATSVEFHFRKNSGTLDVDIDYAKVEVGSNATEYTPPLIAEELPKCQRYYQVINNNTLIGTSTAAGYVGVTYHNIIEMRTKPTLIQLDKVVMRAGGTNYTQSQATNNASYRSTTGGMVSCNNFSGNPTNVFYNSLTDNAVFAFDAEL